MVRFYPVWRRFLAINEPSEGEYIGVDDPGQVESDQENDGGRAVLEYGREM